ncbi:2-phospho-L-lactate transferase [Pseudonocardia phyllosphaerae]|uniref:2-phospho-L-lactate transferase n=1 Tax=Pseudonocardia phyllosphaerae TaxID=3390502 RepID=UPI00397D1C24
MKVTVLVGGVGGARFLQGVKLALGLPPVGPGPENHPHSVDAVVNVGDDIWLHGLRVCPDLDTCMYTLGGGIDVEKGWGRADETWSVKAELEAYGAEPTWFGLGDRDVATHLVRTRMLRAGYPLSQVTEALCHRWQPGVRLLPASDERVETHVVIDNPELDGGAEASEETPPQVAIHFQEWWIKHRAAPKAYRFASVGADRAAILPEARASIAEADVVLVAPSNPVVSIGTIISVPGVPQALAATPAPVVGLSPIVGGRPVRGMADACLSAIGVETSAEGVGRHYGGRGEGGLLDGYLVHTGDTATVPGATVREVPLLMTDHEATADMARAAFDLAGVRV